MSLVSMTCRVRFGYSINLIVAMQSHNGLLQCSIRVLCGAVDGWTINSVLKGVNLKAKCRNYMVFVKGGLGNNTRMRSRNPLEPLK